MSHPSEPSIEPDEHASSRRAMVRGLLGAAAGAAVAAVALDTSAAHAQTGAMQYGTNNNSGIDTTNLYATVASGRALSVTNWAAGGYSYGGEADTVYGGHGTQYGINLTSANVGASVFGTNQGIVAQSQYGAGVYATSQTSVGAVAYGSTADLVLGGDQPAPIGRTDSHIRGELLRDNEGSVWCCVANGSPGTWRRLAGAGTAGSLHPIEPTRVYDSRWATGGGPLVAGTNRGVDIGAGRNLTTGVVETPGLVPMQATAVQYTITVTDTVGSGFLAITSIGATEYKASAINWSAAGQSVANSTMGKLTSPELRLWCGGGGGRTHAIVDVLGYYL